MLMRQRMNNLWNRDSLLAGVLLGVALARQGKLDEAIVHFTLALRLRPDYEQAQLNLQLTQEERESAKNN
jgi:tetratricopeptide (TPR) repeat protein